MSFEYITVIILLYALLAIGSYNFFIWAIKRTRVFRALEKTLKMVKMMASFKQISRRYTSPRRE